MNEYQRLKKKLFSLVSAKPKLKLDNIVKANAYLNYPNGDFKSIHIAGTNGKGSVATKVAYGLSFSGYKTGLYTSPHILSHRERIAIDGKSISKKDTVCILKELFGLAKELKIDLSFFEILTLLAFLYFSKKKVDFAVIETGLGGRLDATNIITPIISVITSISFDHTNILGNTLEAIANEKAQIIKPNVPVVLGPKANLKPIIKKAKINNSLIYLVAYESSFYDLENQKVAKTVFEVFVQKYFIEKKNITKALKIRPKGRFEVLTTLGPKAVIYDVAHNVDAFLELKKALNIFFPGEKIRVILGFSKFKDIEGCLKIVNTFAHFIHVISVNNIKAISAEEIQKVLLKLNFLNFQVENDIKKAISVAKNLVKKNNEVLLICGSFYVVNEVKLHL